MATVRHLGLFALPTSTINASRCVQPASAFTTTTFDGVVRTIAPANLPQSTYTAVSLSRAMLWLWRIKSFSISANLSVDDPGFDPFDVEIPAFSVPNLKFNNLSAAIENEKEKACDVGMFYAMNQSADFEGNDPFPTVGDWKLSVSIGALQPIWANYPSTNAIAIGSGGQRVRSDAASSEFYVPVLLNLFVRGGDTTHDLTSGSAASSQSGPAKSVVWNITDSLGSVSRPFIAGSSAPSGEINIEAAEYWPYDPGDGLGPIYDSTTGAKLREFPE